jgi:hypothetical protein
VKQFGLGKQHHRAFGVDSTTSATRSTKDVPLAEDVPDSLVDLVRIGVSLELKPDDPISRNRLRSPKAFGEKRGGLQNRPPVFWTSTAAMLLQIEHRSGG